MARITVEDCIDKFPSRFELVLVAAQRAKKLHSGESPSIEIDNDKNTVIALREIAEVSIPIDDMKENLIQEYQTITISDEEEENLDISNSENDQDKKLDASDEIEQEIKELSKNEDADLEESFEIKEDIESPETDNSSEIDEKESIL